MQKHFFFKILYCVGYVKRQHWSETTSSMPISISGNLLKVFAAPYNKVGESHLKCIAVVFQIQILTRYHSIFPLTCIIMLWFTFCILYLGNKCMALFRLPPPPEGHRNFTSLECMEYSAPLRKIFLHLVFIPLQPTAGVWEFYILLYVYDNSA